MRVVAQRHLEAFWTVHAEAEIPLRTWLATARAANWATMNDVQSRWPKAKVLNGERVRFEICGGAYRLIVAIYFPARIVWIKFIGSHAEYDKIDALTVSAF